MSIENRLARSRLLRKVQRQAAQEQQRETPTYVFAGFANGKPQVRNQRGEVLECDRLLRNGAVRLGEVVAVVEAQGLRIIANQAAPQPQRREEPQQPVLWLWQILGGAIARGKADRGRFEFGGAPSAEMAGDNSTNPYQSPFSREVDVAASVARASEIGSAAPGNPVYITNTALAILDDEGDPIRGYDVFVYTSVFTPPDNPTRVDPFFAGLQFARVFRRGGTLSIAGSVDLVQAINTTFVDLRLTVSIYRLSGDRLRGLRQLDDLQQAAVEALGQLPDASLYPDYLDATLADPLTRFTASGEGLSAARMDSPGAIALYADYLAELQLEPVSRFTVALTDDAVTGSYQFAAESEFPYLTLSEPIDAAGYTVSFEQTYTLPDPPTEADLTEGTILATAEQYLVFGYVAPSFVWDEATIGRANWNVEANIR